MLIRTFAFALLLSGAAHAQKRAPLPPISDTILLEHVELGQELESRVDGDLNGDGDPDTAYIIASEDARTVHVLLLRIHGSGVQTHKPAGELKLPESPLGSATLTIERGVLKIEDLTGGTTAISATYRFRLDPKRQRMRLIGLDGTLYSRTLAHDDYEVSWNLLTGGAITRELHLNKGSGDAAYDKAFESKRNKQHAPLYMEQVEDPELLMVELRGKN